MRFNRSWAMPSMDTFSIKPIGEFVKRYLAASKISVDPFARNCNWATHTNDLNPETSAQDHMDAEDYLSKVAPVCDLVLFDPPYSPRQISECYKNVGRKVGMVETQSALLYKRVRDAVDAILQPGGIVLSFGWSTNGMGITRGYKLIEVLLCAHGGAHNDTICIAEKSMIKLKTEIYNGAIACTNPDCVHDIKVAHALVSALEEWHFLHCDPKYHRAHEGMYFDILEDADNILREKYGVTE